MRLRHTLALFLAVTAGGLALALAGEFGSPPGPGAGASDERAPVTELEALGVRLQRVLQNRMLLAANLAGYVQDRPAIEPEAFRRYAASLMPADGTVRALELAPDAEVRYIYPLEGNEGALGLDLRTRPGQAGPVAVAEAVNGLRVVGPLHLVQGGVGVVAQQPIHTGAPGQQSLWGFAVAVLDLPALLAQAGWPADSPYALIYASGEQERLLYGDPAVAAAPERVHQLVLPNETWLLAAGMPAEPDWNAQALLLVPLLLFAGGGVWARSAWRRHRSALREAEAANRLLESSPLPLFVIRYADRRVLRANPAAVRLFGLDPAALPTVDALLEPASRGLFDLAGESGAVDGAPVAFRSAEGEGEGLVWLRTGACDGVPILILGLAETACTACEQAQRDRFAAEQRQLLSGLVHRIRTPLNGILGAAELLGRGRQPDGAGLREGIARAGRSLEGVVEDIAALADGGGQPPLPLRAEQLLEEVADRLRAGPAAAAVDLRTAAGEGLGRFLTDQRPLLRFMLTALGERLLPVAGGRLLLLSAAAAEGRVVFDVRVPNRPLPEQEPPGLDEFPLALEARLQCLADGFRLSLALAGTPPPPAPGGRLRVLVAEDDPVSRMVLSAMVESLGHLADTVQDGAEALRAASSHRYDLVLLDMQMPEMDGVEAGRLLRRQPASPRLLAVTADALPQHLEAYAREGFERIFTKPVRLEELREALGVARAQAPADAAESLVDTTMHAEERGLLGEAHWERLVAVFRESGTADLEALLQAGADGDAEATARHAHRLAGAAANMGLPALSTAARRIEQQVRAQRSTHTDELDELERLYHESLQALTGPAGEPPPERAG